MANFFIAVGGTGQNVALAYYRLAKLCGYEPAKIYVMDSDLSVSHQQPSFLPLEPIPIEPCIEDLQRKSFRNLFNPTGDANVDSMLSVLFTSKELRTPIDDGMFGRPSVGSATIMDKIVLIDNDTTPGGNCKFSDQYFANLLITLQGPGNHNVVICGSAKGGTGAGGVPTLAKYLSNKVDKTKVKIITLYFLRHFNILLRTGELRYDEIKNEQLKLNAESGMCYMADEISNGVDACVLFGLLEPIDIPYREAQAQEEEDMFLYLLAAITGNNAFYTNLAKLFPPNPQKIYAYWIPYDMASKISNLMISDIKVYLPGGRDVSLDQIPKLAKATIDFLEIFSKYINPLPKYSFVPSLITPKKLRQAINTLKNNQQMDKGNVLDNIVDHIKGYKTEIANNLEWFERLLRKESDLANQKPSSTVLSPNNKGKLTTITGENYEKTKEQPMGFIRGWVKRTGWSNLNESPDFIKPLVIGLRRSINSAFLNKAFGEDIWNS